MYAHIPQSTPRRFPPLPGLGRGDMKQSYRFVELLPEPQCPIAQERVGRSPVTSALELFFSQKDCPHPKDNFSGIIG